MPVYNTVKFLKRSIDSIIAQTFTNWEFVIIDDGSKDNSGVVCDEYIKNDYRIIVIHKINGGAGSARNIGLHISNGEYVVFPDSDDWIEKVAYENCITLMCKVKADMLLFGSVNTLYDEHGNVIKEEKRHIVPCYYKTSTECRKNVAELINQYPMGGPSDKIYRMSIIRDNNVEFPNLRRMQDGVFNLLYFEHICSFIAVDKCFYHFTMHSADYQRKKIPTDFIKCLIQYHETIHALFDKWGVTDKKNLLKTDNYFSDLIIAALFTWLPSEKPTFNELYKHIKLIVSNVYIHKFYKSFAKNKKLRKLEIAVKYKMTLLLSLYAFRSTKRK